MSDSKLPPWLEGIRGDFSIRLIQSPSRVIRVLAGPGVGKTTCLVRRAARLVSEETPNRILRKDIFVGTFTRVIIKELNSQFARKPTDTYDVKTEGEPTVRTLHSHATRILQANKDALQGREFRFLLGYEESAMLCDIADAVKEQFPTLPLREKELNHLQSLWAHRGSLDDARFEGALLDWLLAHRAMLIGEVLSLATNAITNRSIKPERYKHVFVDEYQDLTECEQAFVDLITADDGSIVVLGDNDQSIYGFRDNHPDGITAFPSDETRKRVLDDIPLPDNYRCGSEIVKLANEIAAAGGTSKTPMNPMASYEGIVHRVVWQRLDDEIQGLAEVIKTRKDTTFLVLVTRQFIGYELKRLIGDDAVTTFREEVLKIAYVRERFALATLLANEDDAVSLRAWLSLEGNSPRHDTKRNADSYKSALSSGKRGLELIRAIADGSVVLSGDGKGNIVSRCKTYLKFKESVPTELKPLLEVLFDPVDAEKITRPAKAQETPSDKKDRLRLEQLDRDKARGDLGQLRLAALRLIDLAPVDQKPDLDEIMSTLRYRIGTRAPLWDDDFIPRVRIMTLHGAKGLESDTVVVAGLADEIIPGEPDDDPEKERERYREQRRVLYVAVTRAKRELILSWSLAMNSLDMPRNRIRRTSIVSTVNGMRYAALSKTNLLPITPEPPADGKPWMRAQIRAAEQKQNH